MELIKNVKHGEEFSLRNLVQLEPGRVNSLTLSQMPGCKITVFAIAAGEDMSSHAAAGDAMVTCLEGKAQIVIDDIVHEVSPGQTIVIPANAPHSVRALEPYKMLLVVVKPQE